MAELDRHARDRVLLPNRPLRKMGIAGDPAQHRIGEASAATMSQASRLLYRFVDHRMGGYPIEKEQLVDGNPEGCVQTRFDLVERSVTGDRDHLIESSSPAQGPQYELMQEAPVPRVAALGRAIEKDVER